MAAYRTSTLLLVLLLALCPRPGSAEAPLSPVLAPESGPNGAENVWSVGISKAHRRDAEALFLEGNALLKESLFVSAAAKYRDALEHWDHPNIRYNLALALMNLDQPIEMYQHLRAATRFGPAPLGNDRFEHAKNYLALLDKQVAHVQVRCATPGAKVEMDGQPLFVSPGRYEGLVRPGMHTVVARREGFVTHNAVRMLDGGKKTDIDVELKTLDDLTQVRRRWSPWIPWTIVGAGAVIALGGGALHYSASQKVNTIDSASKSRCPTGCPSEPSDLASLRTQAASMQKLAVGAYAVGGAAIVFGGIMVSMNGTQVYTRSYDSEGTGSPPRAALEIAPVLAFDTVGLSAAGRF